MDLWEMVKTVGTSVVRNAVPGGGMIVDMVNGFLPDDSKLPTDATGDDIKTAIKALPPEQQATLMSKELDVDMTQIKESNSTVRAMLESDAANPQSTRPHIAKGAFYIIAFTIVVAMLIWGYGVIKGDEKMVKAVMDGWPFIVSMVAPLVTLLWAYFGVLKKEHKQKLDAAQGVSQPGGIGGIVSALMKR